MSKHDLAKGSFSVVGVPEGGRSGIDFRVRRASPRSSKGEEGKWIARTPIAAAAQA
jgi:hypothetical protein